jgi:hypothetical protein
MWPGAGVFGKPYVDLSNLLDLKPLASLHEEICLALAQLPESALGYTGGSHLSMGIVPPRYQQSAQHDYQDAIVNLDDADWQTFTALAPKGLTLSEEARRSRDFGEERTFPLSKEQMRWLKIRHGVYFPWKLFCELMPSQRWDDKSDAEGKAFTPLAEAHFPKTLAYVRSLPFARLGRCILLGLEANDYGTVHRDGDPGPPPDQFITLVPGYAEGQNQKSLFLYDADNDQEHDVLSPAYWFNDRDYHGVRAGSTFRYSLRVDGVFTAEFYETLMRQT